MRTLVAIPVYNEAKHVESVLSRVLARHADVLVVDDGSTDATAELVSRHPVDVIRRRVNRGYGASMREAFRFAARERYDWLITMDCDDQHEPDAIPEFIEVAGRDDADVISGSRYLAASHGNDRPPPERRAINVELTREINCRLGRCLGTLITDAFCGFKAYRVEGLRGLRPTVRGYAFPMQFWVQAAWAGLRVRELPVRLIYNDPNRSFGATLDDPARRLRHYRAVLHRELLRRAPGLPCASLVGISTPGKGCGCQ